MNVPPINKENPMKSLPEGSRRPMLVAGALVLAMSMTLAGCGGTDESSDSYKIGVIVDQSGPVRSVSAPQLVGLKAAVQAVNDAGGVNGHKVELVIRDDGSDAAKGVAAFRELVAKYKVTTVTGFTSSTTIPGVVNFAEQSKVSMLGAGVPGDLLSPVNPVVFTTVASINAQGKAAVDYLKTLVEDGKLPAKPRVATFNYSSPAGESWKSIVEPYVAEVGFDLVADETAAVGAASYSAAVEAIAASKPDAVLVTAAETDLINMMKSAKSAGLDPETPIVNYSFGSGSTALREVAALGFAQYVASTPFNSSGDTAGSKAYVEAVTKSGGDPSMVMVPEGYAQIEVITDVLEECGYPCSSDEFLSIVGDFESDLNGLAFGPVKYDEGQHMGPTSVAFLGWDAATDAAKPVKSGIVLAGPTS